MAKHVSMTPAQGESLDAFADRMAKKVAEHFGTTQQDPVPDEKASAPQDTGDDPSTD